MAHTVATVVVDGANPFEFAVACEVFGIDRSELGGGSTTSASAAPGIGGRS